MTTEVPSNFRQPSGNDQRLDSAYVLWHSLQQHPCFNEYYRQIRACLLCNDLFWCSYTYLRTNSSAADFLDDLHISLISLIPPHDIFNIILRLRGHPYWPAVHAIIVTKMGKLRHQSFGSTSARSSAFSSTSLERLSSVSATTFSNPTSGHGVFDTIIDATEHKEVKFNTPPNDTAPRSSIAVTASGKASRRATKGQKFTCPHPRCWGERVFSRVGDFDKHIRHDHPGTPPLNAYDHLKPNPVIGTSFTPIKTEITDNLSAFPPDYSSPNYAEVNTFNDFPPTRPEIQLPMEHLVDTRALMVSPGHYRDTGIRLLQGSGSAWYIPPGMQSPKGANFLDLDNDYDDHMDEQ